MLGLGRSIGLTANYVYKLAGVAHGLLRLNYSEEGVPRMRLFLTLCAAGRLVGFQADCAFGQHGGFMPLALKGYKLKRQRSGSFNWSALLGKVGIFPETETVRRRVPESWGNDPLVLLRERKSPRANLWFRREALARHNGAANSFYTPARTVDV